MSRYAITDLAESALTLLKALSTPTSPHYSCSLSKLPPSQRISLAFALADRSFPFALTPRDLAIAYTIYEPMAHLALNGRGAPLTPKGLASPTLTELKPLTP